MLIHSTKLVVQTLLKQQHDNPSKRIPLQLSTHSLQIFFLLCSKTIIAAILIHQNAINSNLTIISKLPYLFCLFRFTDFIFAYFITSTSSTENNNALTKTSATKTICRQKPAAYLAAYKNVSPLKISAFYR